MGHYGILLSVQLNLHKPGLTVSSIPMNKVKRLTQLCYHCLRSHHPDHRGSLFWVVAIHFRISRQARVVFCCGRTFLLIRIAISCPTTKRNETGFKNFQEEIIRLFHSQASCGSCCIRIVKNLQLRNIHRISLFKFRIAITHNL